MQSWPWQGGESRVCDVFRKQLWSTLHLPPRSTELTKST